MRWEKVPPRFLEPSHTGVLRHCRLSENSLLIQNGNIFNDLHSIHRKQCGNPVLGDKLLPSETDACSLPLAINASPSPVSTFLSRVFF